MTRYIALLGYPLKHSISPLFQQAALDHYGLDIKYEAREVPSGDLPEAVGRLRRPENLGANVTVPHKEAVLPLLDRREERVGLIGAVNTIVREEGALVGYNTDAPAFLRALVQDGGFEPQGKRVVILGAGGGARAAAFSLLGARVSFIAIFGRSQGRAESLAGELKQRARPGQEVQARPWEARLGGLPPCDLIVQATPLGTLGRGESPLPARLFPAGALAYDLVYNPPETYFLREARRAGCRVLGGLPMLIYQGAASFELWTGLDAPLEVMFRAAERALGVKC